MADDTRVVQMQFENRQFERNIAKSQSSLEKFKASLNFDEVGKGLAKFGESVKNLAFDTLSNNIQKLTDKFTGLGNAGEYVLSRIRASLEGVALQAEQFVKSMTMEQIQVGQNKYDALTKSVQTIVASGSATEEKAYSVMERVMEYTNQTSHSFETMVSQISSLTSIGIPLEKAEKMMEAFANASTKAGADASHAAIAMQTYSKALGSYLTKNEFDTLNLTAKVVTKEWREEMIAAGLAAGDLEKDTKGVIKTAKKYGKQVEVTADNLENTLNKKWAGKKTLSIFSERYMFGETVEELKHPEDAADSFGKTAYLTGQRALTFADALNAVKEAISGGWMTTFRIIFGDLTDAMNLWTGSCNKVIDALSGLSEARNKVLEVWRELGGRDSILKLIFGEMEDTEGNVMYEGAYGIVDMFTDIGNMISEAFWDTFMNLIPKDQQKAILDQVNSNLEALGLEKPFESFEELWNSDFFKESGGRTSFLGGALQGITEDVQKFVQGINDWFNEIDPESGLTRMEKIETVLTAIGRTIAFLLEIGGGIVHFFEVLGGEDYLGPSIKAISDLLVNLGIATTEAENGVSNSGGITTFFENLAAVLQPACELINLVIESITGLITAMVSGEGENQTFGNTFIAIGDAIKDVITFITDLFRPIANFIAEVNGIISELFQNGFTEENITAAKEKLSAAFTRLWEGLKTVIQPILEQIGEFIKMLWEEVKTRVSAYLNDPNTFGGKMFAKLKEFLGPTWNWIVEKFEAIKGFFSQLKLSFQNMTLYDIIKSIFSFNTIGSLAEKIKNIFAGADIYTILKLILGGVAIFSLISMINNIKKAFKKIGEFFEDVGGNLKQGFIGEYEWFSDRLLKIAEGIGILVACVMVLGSMKTENLLQGVIAITAVMGAFAAFMYFMGKNKATFMQQTALSGSLAALVGSIAVLVLALLPFAFISWDQFGKMMAGLGSVLLELIAFMFITSKLPIGTGQLGGFIAFALSIGILVKAIKPFAKMNWDEFANMMAGLGGVLLELIAFMIITSKLPIGTGQLGGFIKFALSLGILILAIQSFKDMEWEQFGKMMAGLGGVLLELIAFMIITSKLPIGTGQLGGFIKFALSIWILIETIKPFANMTWEQYAKCMAGLGGVLLEIIIFMELFKVLGLSTLALDFKGIIVFALAIWLLVETIKPFANMTWDQYAKCMAALGGVLLEIIIFMELFKVLGLSTLALDFAGILGFAAAIWILVEAIKPFADMDWEQYGRCMAGLAGIMAGLLIFMAIVNKIPVNWSSIGAVIAICLSLGVMALLLSTAMNEVRNLKWEVITAFTAGMATMILAMAGAIAILSAVPLGAGIKGIALIGIALAALVGIIALLGPMLIDAMGNSFANLSGKLEMISGLLKGFTDRMGQVDDGNIDKASGIFDKLKEMIGKLAGWGKFTEDLNNFAYSMFVLGTGMEIFNNHVGNAAGDIESNGQAALKFIQDLSACAGDLDTISKMNMDGLIAAIAMLGGAMSIYAYGAKEIQGYLDPGEAPDEQTVGQSIEILKQISTGLSEAGGFTIPSDMPDDQALSLFGASLAALATALVKFEEAGSGLGSGTDKALEVLDFFRKLKEKLISAEFSKNLKASIGIFDKNEVSKDDLAAFGTNIEQLGLAMKAFNESTTVLDEATGERKAIDFSNAVSTLDSLVKLQGKLGWDFGPLIKFFAGRKKDFTDLGGEIEALGTALSDFNNKLSGVDEQGNPKLDPVLFTTAIDVADQVATYLNTLKEKMGPVGGVIVEVSDFFDGYDFNFTTLKTQLGDLAEGLGSLGQLKVDKKLLTVDETTGIFEVVDKCINYLNSLKTKMSPVGGLFRDIGIVFTGRDYNFTDLKTQLTSLGEGLNGLSGFEIKDLPTKEQMEEAFPMIDSLIDYMNTLKDKVGEGEGSVGGIINGFKTLVIGRGYNFEDLQKQLSAIGTGLNSLAGVNIDSEGKTVFNENGRGAALDTMDALIEYMQTLTGKIGRVGGIAQFFNDIWNGKEADFQYLGTQLGYLGDGLGKFQTGITAHGEFDAAKVSNALGALDHLASMMQTFSVLSKSMDSISQSYGLSSYTTQSLVQNMVNALFQMTDVHELEGHAGATSVVAQLAEFVKEFDYQLSELGGLENADAVGILNGVATAISTLVTAAKDMQNDQGQLAVDFSVIGTQICNGVITGIEAGQSGVIDSAVAMAVAAYEAAKGALDINSPSRIFAGLGLSVGEGFIKGMDDQETAVEDASENLSNGAVDSATNAMAAFAALMSQEIDANPTITPVLDLSNITAGSEAINDILNGEKQLSLAGAGADYSSAAIPQNDSGTSEYRGQDLSWISTAIDSLGQRIESMSATISNMKIVLDTGALVGGVTDGVNRNLGAKTTYGRRRN